MQIYLILFSKLKLDDPPSGKRSKIFWNLPCGFSTCVQMEF